MPRNRGETEEDGAVSTGQRFVQGAPQRRCLIVEDDPILAAILVDTLGDEGFQCQLLTTGAHVPDMVRQLSPEIVLLDLMLPDGDGFSICRTLRGFTDVPLIMITGRAEEADRLRGLDLGADDYICKPFHAGEVAARVRAVLRRSGGRRTAGSEVPLALDLDGMLAYWHGQRLNLTPIEFRMLSLLGQGRGRVYSRAQLLDAACPDQPDVSDRAVDSHVKNLRRKLREAGEGHDPIDSVYGVGYRFSLEPAQARG